jgi:Ca2+-binding EF-hand superfamily protein
MKRLARTLMAGSAAVALATLFYVPNASADDMASFASGGYARSLRTMAMMHMIDTNKDGMISQDEWTTYQEKTFAALDTNKSGFLDEKQFVGSGSQTMAFATAAYARGLRSNAMFKHVDSNGDGKISHDEFISYQQKIFEMLDSGKKGMVGPTDFIRKGG